MVADKIPCYIMSLDSGTAVNFNVEIPDSISDSYSTAFTNQATKGRSNPFKAYSNSGPRSISFTVTMALDYRRDLVAVVDALREMLKPVDAGYILPPRVKVKIGKVLDISAVPMSFEVTWRDGYKDKTYQICDCSFSFEQVEDEGTFQSTAVRTYQIANSTSAIAQSFTAAKMYSLDGGKTKINTGADGSTLGDVTIGKTVTLLDVYDTFSSAGDCQDGTAITGSVVPGDYKITGKFRDCVKITYEDKDVWVKLF